MAAQKSRQGQQQQGLIIGAAVAVAVIAAVIFIILSNQDTGETSGIDYEALSESNEAGVQMFRTEDGGHVIGNPDAPITIVAFEDFMCPACQAYKPTVNEIFDELVLAGLAKFEYRFLPTQGATAFYAAQVAECTADIGGEDAAWRFWVAHDELFAMASARRLDGNLGSDLADRMGLSTAELIECTENADQVDVDVALARSNGLGSTPTLRYRIGSDDAPLQAFPGYPESGGPPFDVVRNQVNAANGIIQ